MGNLITKLHLLFRLVILPGVLSYFVQEAIAPGQLVSVRALVLQVLPVITAVSQEPAYKHEQLVIASSALQDTLAPHAHPTELTTLVTEVAGFHAPTPAGPGGHVGPVAPFVPAGPGGHAGAVVHIFPELKSNHFKTSHAGQVGNILLKFAGNFPPATSPAGGALG